MTRSVLFAVFLSGVALPAPDADSLLKEVASKQVLELVGQQKSEQALPILKRDAERLDQGKNPKRWHLVKIVADWHSEAELALLALRRLVTLSPQDREVRFVLSQRLLWKGETAEALAHVQWLRQNAQSLTAAELEVATWVLVGEQHPDAVAVAVEWSAKDPKSTSARWVIADLSHWTARWRAASEQYEHLAEANADQEKVTLRKEMIRHDHPNRIELGAVVWSDNTGVNFQQAHALGTYQMSAPVRLDGKVAAGRWERDSGEYRSIDVLRATLLARFELFDEYWPELELGAEGDSEQNIAPTVSLGVRWSVSGWIFGRGWLSYDRFPVSIDSAGEDIRVAGGNYALYAEPHPWVFVSSSAELKWISDDNLRARGLLAVGAHNPDALQLEPRLFAEQNWYESPRPGASPYFVPEDPLMVGVDVTLRYQMKPELLVQVSAGLVEQNEVMASIYGALLRAELFGHLQLSASYGRIGSPEYNQDAFRGSVGWLF